MVPLIFYLKRHHYTHVYLFSNYVIIFYQLCFTFRSVFHFELICKRCGFLFFLHVDIQLFQHHLLMRLSLLHCMAFPTLSKISWLYLWMSNLELCIVTLICLFFHEYHTCLDYDSFMVKSWNWVASGLQFCFSPLSLYWLFWFFCLSTEIVVSYQ